MIVAEELNMPWQKIRFEFAPSKDEFGGRNTGGSSSVSGSIRDLQKLGAAAKEMLITAGAKQLKTKPDNCSLNDGLVINDKNQQSVVLKEIIAAAKTLPVPQAPTLKDRKDYQLIGKSVPRLDIDEKINGQAKFGIDTELEGMVYAAIQRHPVIGARIANRALLNNEAKKIAVELVDIPEGIAAISTSFWSAQQALLTLPIEYNTEDVKRSSNSSEIDVQLDNGLNLEGNVFLSCPSSEAATSTFEAQYSVPYLAHAPMEPLNCTARVNGDFCEICLGTQDVNVAKLAAAETLNISPDNVTVNLQYLGGAFGARLNHEVVVQAVSIAKTINKPVKVIWSREQDLQTNYYRPAVKSKFTAGFSQQGKLTSIEMKLCSSSIMEQLGPSHRFYQRYKDTGTDILTIHGLTGLPYSLPDTTIRTINTPLELRVAPWRSVGTSQNLFFLESFIDELANHQNQNPLDYRRTLSHKNPRMVNLIDELEKESQWGSPQPGTAQGIAIGQAFGSYVGHVAEVSLIGNKLKVNKVTCAIDCGFAINPNIVKQQVESAIVFALTATLYGEITVGESRVKQSNFHDYRLLSLAETPIIQTHIINSDNNIGGIGEVGVPTLAPAVTNAVFALTGERVRSLPLSKHQFKQLR